jgi:methionyl-tRNA formyltransferase
MKKIVLLTGNELRHQYLIKYIANQPDTNVLATFSESSSGNIVELVSNEEENSLRTEHLHARSKVEKDFFQLYCEELDYSANIINILRGEINNNDHVDYIIKLNPDLIVSYGCSIIQSQLLNIFKNRFMNIHLGLSPYYRGAGTNFWPIVNNEFSLIGTTFMHIDEGIDTGDIIHQIRAKIYPFDNIHSIGNRLIIDSVKVCAELIKNFNNLQKHEHKNSLTGKVFKKSDFTEESIKLAYNNLDSKIKNYLSQKSILDKKFPIINAFES